MRNLAATVSTWKRLVLVSALAATATLSLQMGGPVAGAGPGPTPLAGAGVTVLGDTVVLASTAQVTVTFENQTGADLDASLWSTGVIDPAATAAGTPAEIQLAAAGVDVAQLMANSPNATNAGNTCTGLLAVAEQCTVTVQTAATVAPVGVSLRFADSGGVTVADVIVVWPSLGFPAPANDDWANAKDVSGLAVPPYDGTFTGVGVAGTTVGATQETAEPVIDDDGFGNPSTLGTVWYRYESPPGGFEGLLGYQVTPGFLVASYAAYEPDPFNPILGLYPDEGPGALDRLAVAPQYTVRRDLPGGLFYGAPVVRVEPGQQVWFQVAPNPRVPGVAPGPFTFELYHVADSAEQIATAAPAYNCGVACGPLSTFSQIGYADTFAASPQPQGPASSWLTFEVATRGTFSVTASSQKASRRESDRPLTVEVYSAPTSAAVSDPAALGQRIAWSNGGPRPVTTWLNGQWATVQQWQSEVTNLTVTPGRYYVRISGDPTFVSYWARLTPPALRPPIAGITSPTDGQRFARGEAVPGVGYHCHTPEGFASATVLVDGVPFGNLPMPSTPGTHVVVLTCFDITGASDTDTVTYTVDPLRPPIAGITSPTDGQRFAHGEAVPGVGYHCHTPEGFASATVLVDGVPFVNPPMPTAPGTHVVVLTCFDVTGASDTDTVTYTVDPPPPLVAPDFAVTVGEDETASIDLLARVSAGSGVTVALTGVTGSPRAAVTPSASGTATYVPVQDANGPDSFRYTVTASDGRTATGTVSITVTPVNDPPVAVDDALAVDARRSIEIDLAQLVANDTDVDGDALSATSITRSGGTVTGQLAACTGQRPLCRIYTAPASAGTESFDYVVSDGNGGTDTGRLTMTVRPSALPDDLAIRMPCDNLSISGSTTGIRITRSSTLVVVRGTGQVGPTTARFRAVGFVRTGFAFGSVRVRNGSTVRTLGVTSISNPAGDTWLLSGTYRVGRQACPFQIEVRDGG